MNVPERSSHARVKRTNAASFVNLTAILLDDSHRMPAILEETGIIQRPRPLFSKPIDSLGVFSAYLARFFPRF